MVNRPDFNRVWAENGTNVDPDLDTTHPLYVPDRYEDDGWNDGEKPPNPWMNFLQNNEDTWTVSVCETGISTWGSDVTYEQNALVYHNGDAYIALTSSTGVSPVGNPLVWGISLGASQTFEWLRNSIDTISASMTTHIANKGDPHQVDASQMNAYNKAEIDLWVNNLQNVQNIHANNTSNPHGVTALQLNAVPVTGGTFTGRVSLGDSLTGFGASGLITSSSSSLALVGGNYHFGIYAGIWNSPYYRDTGVNYEVLNTGNYIKLRSEIEPQYHIPPPRLRMPLVDSAKMWEGIGSNTFARSTTATYWNGSGVYTAAIDELRHQAEGTLIEPPATNVILDSENLGGRTGSPAVTLNGQLGDVNIHEITKTLASKNEFLAIRPHVAAWRTFSLRVRAGTSDTISFGLGLYNGIDWNDTTYEIISGKGTLSNTDSVAIVSGLSSTTWTYIRATRTSISSGGYIYPGGHTSSNIGDSVQVACWQLEDNLLYTSYIPTIGTSLTRGADLLEVSEDNKLQVPYTLSIRAKCQSYDVGTSQKSGLWAWDNSGQECVLLNGNGRYVFQRSPVSLDSGILATEEATYTVVVGETDTTLYVDGTRVASQATSDHTYTNPVFLLGRGSFGWYTNGFIKDFQLWGEELTAQQVTTIT